MSSPFAGTPPHPQRTFEARSLGTSRLPARPRAVLEAILSKSSTILEEGLVKTLNDFDQQLFRLAEQARSNEMQQRCFEALHELRRGRPDIAPRFLLVFETRLAKLGPHQQPTARAIAAPGVSNMSLVDDAEFEQNLALQEISSKAEIRHSQALYLLGRRFAVLAGTRAFEPEELVIGPQALTECLREATACLDLATEFRVQLYRAFDRHAMPLLQHLYEQVNAICVEQRILPNLSVTPPRTAPKPAAPATTKTRTPARAPQASSPEAAPTQAPPAQAPSAPASPFQPGPPAAREGTAPVGAYGWGPGTPPAAPGTAAGATTPAVQPGLPGAREGTAPVGAYGWGPGTPPAAPGTAAGATTPAVQPGLPAARQGTAPVGAYGWGSGTPPAAPGTAGGTSTSTVPGPYDAAYTGAPATPGALKARQRGPADAAMSRGSVNDADTTAGTGPTSVGDNAGQSTSRAARNSGASPGTRRTGHSAAAIDRELSGIPGAAGLANPMTGWPVIQPATSKATGSATTRLGAHQSEPDDGDTATTSFESMRQLLAKRRTALGHTASASPESTHAVSTQDVQSVLAALQSRPAPTLQVGGKAIGRSIAHLKHELLTQLHQLSPQKKTPRLDDADNDTIDLVGMLFDHLARDIKPASSVQDLMARLQVPLLRVALQDKSFFHWRNHPARQLLNAIIEAGLFWFDDTGEDRQIVDKMRLVVDRISSEYNGNIGLFEELLGDLARHLQTIARKSEVAERRHVDAAKGREKLELARDKAARTIAGHIGRRNLPGLIRTLLEQAWTDVLALTILRQGEDSAAYRQRLDVADRLIALAERGKATGGTGGPADLELQVEIEGGLAQVGYHAADVRSVVKRLFNLVDEAAGEEVPTATELAIKLKARSRLGAESEAQPAPVAARETAAPLNAEEQRVLERLRTIPFGTWFNFKINQQGDQARRKLSWFSPLTGRCLFVNQRGARVDERTMEQLARLIVKGQVSVVEARRESLIDRAWSAIMDTLQQFTGSRLATAGSEA